MIQVWSVDSAFQACGKLISVFGFPQGALGRKVMILVRRGACLSKIESKTESYWSQGSVISWNGELYKAEERISRRRLSGSMARSKRDVMVSLALGRLLTAKVQ